MNPMDETNIDGTGNGRAVDGAAPTEAHFGNGAEGTMQAGARAAAPAVEWIGTLSVQLGQPTVISPSAHGTRIIVQAVSGTLEGPDISGTIGSMTGDWMLVRGDGVGELDVRGTVQTENGVLYFTSTGYLTGVMDLLPRWQRGESIPRDEYSYVASSAFETDAPAYEWLQRTLVIGIGSLGIGGVSYELYAVRA